MTLKEQMYFDCTLSAAEDRDRMVKIADEFAIGFAEWLTTKPRYSNKESLEIYKKEKGL
jgi:hypothetical protein